MDYDEFLMAGYRPSGKDVTVCVHNETEFPSSLRDVYVTDYLKKVSNWPAVNNPGPLVPKVNESELYNSSNGFQTTF